MCHCFVGSVAALCAEVTLTIPSPVIVAIPVRDEAFRIRDCLDALDGQENARVDEVVLLLNNCTDQTADIARGFACRSSMQIHVLEHLLPPARANAGHARRLAMEKGAKLAGLHGILLTTDADSRVDSRWVAANLAEMARGAEVVAGWVELDAVEWGRIPHALHEADARECAYDALCDEIHALLDPDPIDPWPRHTQASGASLAMTAAAYRLAGGVPPIASGEDRALVAALRRVDAKIRHSPEVHVTVSGRLDGRAPGGMADTIRRRMEKPDAFLDDRLEPAADCARRARLRRRVAEARLTSVPDRSLAEVLQLSPVVLSKALELGLGRAWDRIEQCSPVLSGRRTVAIADLPAEMAAAQVILGQIRSAAPAGRSGILAAET